MTCRSRAIRVLAALAATVGLAQAAPDAQRDPSLNPRVTALLDRPAATARSVLPLRPIDANGPGVVRCFYYPEFTIKELDYGEHGDTAISATPASGPGRPRCGKQDDPGEKLLPDGAGSVFLGAKGGFVFLQSTFGGNGLGPMAIYDGRTAKPLYKGVWQVDSLAAASIENGALSVSFGEGAYQRCSLLTGGARCWATFAQKDGLPPELARRPPPIASCEAAYAKMPKLGQGADRNDPSVVYYASSMTLDRSGRVIARAYGDLSCNFSE